MNVAPINTSQAKYVGEVNSLAGTTYNSSALNTKFGEVLTSVLTHGLLSESDKIGKGIQFTTSHDGSNHIARDSVDVTSIPYSQDQESRLQLAHQALTMPYNGALSVVIERSDSEIPFVEEKIPLTKEQEDMISKESADMQKMLRSSLEKGTQKVATPEGINIANHRMENSFLLIMKSSGQSNYNVASEQTRPSVPANEILAVLVPEAHQDSVSEVQKQLRDAPLADFHCVGQTNELVPDYIGKKGDRIDLNGVIAPNYKGVLADMINKHQGVDVHIVRIDT